MAGAATAGGGGNTRTWPDLVGWDGEEAKEALEAKDPSLNVEMVPYGELKHSPDKPNTVRLWLDADNTVRIVPTLEQPSQSTTSSKPSPNPASTKPANTANTGTKPANTPNTGTKPANTPNTGTKPTGEVNVSTAGVHTSPQHSSGSGAHSRPAHHGSDRAEHFNMGHYPVCQVGPGWHRPRGGRCPVSDHSIEHFPEQYIPPPSVTGEWPRLLVPAPPFFAHESPHRPFPAPQPPYHERPHRPFAPRPHRA